MIRKEPYSQRRLTTIAEGKIGGTSFGHQFGIGTTGVSFTLRNKTHKIHVELTDEELERLYQGRKKIGSGKA